MIAYVDASVPLRVILAQPGRLSSWGEWDEALSSEILGLELRRTIDACAFSRISRPTRSVTCCS
jgi:hypothetical protein